MNQIALVTFDLSEPTFDYLLWVGKTLNPANPDMGFAEALAQWRIGHPLPPIPACPVNAAHSPFPRPSRTPVNPSREDRPS